MLLNDIEWVRVWGSDKSEIQEMRLPKHISDYNDVCQFIHELHLLPSVEFQTSLLHWLSLTYTAWLDHNVLTSSSAVIQLQMT